MGVNALWQLLRAEGMVEHYVGTSTADYRQIVDDVDGLAVAVDLAVWCMQVSGQPVRKAGRNKLGWNKLPLASCSAWQRREPGACIHLDSQADQQTALLPHFSVSRRSAAVARARAPPALDGSCRSPLAAVMQPCCRCCCCRAGALLPSCSRCSARSAA